jgi:hypothetical protein
MGLGGCGVGCQDGGRTGSGVDRIYRKWVRGQGQRREHIAVLIRENKQIGFYFVRWEARAEGFGGPLAVNLPSRGPWSPGSQGRCGIWRSSWTRSVSPCGALSSGYNGVHCSCTMVCLDYPQ